MFILNLKASLRACWLFCFAMTWCNHSLFAASVSFRVETTDMSGQAIDQIAVGEDFMLKGLVQDIRPQEADGAFSAYLDVTYNHDLVSPGDQITYGSDYENFRTAAANVFSTAGELDELGGFSGTSPIGNSEVMLFEIPMQAVNAGIANFSTNPADELPMHEVLLYNLNDPVASDDILYMSKSLNIVPEPEASLLIIFSCLAMLAEARRRR